MEEKRGEKWSGRYNDGEWGVGWAIMYSSMNELRLVECKVLL